MSIPEKSVIQIGYLHYLQRLDDLIFNQKVHIDGQKQYQPHQRQFLVSARIIQEYEEKITEYKNLILDLKENYSFLNDYDKELTADGINVYYDILYK